MADGNGTHVAKTSPTKDELAEGVLEVPQKRKNRKISKAWTNMGYDIYREIRGKEVFNDQQRMQFSNASGCSPGSPCCMNIALFKARTMLKPFDIFALRSSAVCVRGFASTTTPVSKSLDKSRDFLRTPTDAYAVLNDVFPLDRIYDVRLRFSNMTSCDDASLDGRCATLSLGDGHGNHVFNLLLTTGRISPFYSFGTFTDFAYAYARGNSSLKDWILRYPCNLYSIIEHLQRAPTSYLLLKYYAHQTFTIRSKANEDCYLIRFRLVPVEAVMEAYIDEVDQWQAWRTKRRDHEHRPSNYLRKEIWDRVTSGAVTLHLEAQVHVVSDIEDDEEVYNVGLSWPENTHPWREVMEVTLTTPIEEAASRDMEFDLSTLPRGLWSGNNDYKDDYRSVGYGWLLLNEASRPGKCEPLHRHGAAYVVMIKTLSAKSKSALQGRDITLTIIGSEGQAGPLRAKPCSVTADERGHLCSYQFTAIDICEPLVLELEHAGLRMDLEYAVVFNAAHKINVEFPYYGLREERTTLTRGKASLRCTDDHPFIVHHRKFQLQLARDAVRWESRDGLPSGMQMSVDAASPSIAAMKERADDFYQRFLEIEVSTRSSLGNLRKLVKEQFYRRLATTCFKGSEEVEYLASVWMSDEDMGRQFLQSCQLLQRCTLIPDNFPITTAMVEMFLDRGKSLEEEMADGHVYVASYGGMEGATRYVQYGCKRYIAHPIVLFYVRESGDFVPLAIQSHQKPGEDNPIWLPSDNRNDWLFAKLWVKVSEVQYQFLTVICLGGMLIETLTVAMQRNFSEVHPLYKVLRPYLNHAFNVGYVIRRGLLDTGKMADQILSVSGKGKQEIMEKYYAKMKATDLFLPKKLELNGLGDPEKLDDYRPREIGLELWRACEGYVDSIFALYYPTNNDVVQDCEIQSFMKDLHQNGVLHRNGKGAPGVPENLKDFLEAKNWITMVLFRSLHLIEALAYLINLAFIPNSPTTLTLPPATKKSTTTLEYIMRAMPDEHISLATVATVENLAKLQRDQLQFYEREDGYFTDPESQQITVVFRSKLREILQRMRDESTVN